MVQVELVDLQQGGDACEHTEIQELGDEGVPIPILQRIVEPVVPFIEQDRDADQAQLGGDDRRQQNTAGPTVLGPEIGDREAPDGGQQRGETGHGDLPIWH